MEMGEHEAAVKRWDGAANRPNLTAMSKKFTPARIQGENRKGRYAYA
jgi:hypothetical protein